MTEGSVNQVGTSSGLSREVWTDAFELPCQLSVEIEIPLFTVQTLLELGVDSIVDSGHRLGANLPVRANQQVIGWAEFDVAEDNLAVRLTEMI
jgi:flagellar motor switch/type III secretory pathway protein FliN